METTATKQYRALIDVQQTEQAIAVIKETFPKKLSQQLNLKRATAPVIVPGGLGINDDLNGVEQPVHFMAKALGHQRIEIVQSLAKWKRLTLWKQGVDEGKGIYTDMNALRPDEIPDSTHSIYVDQWDWEKHIAPKDRTVEYFRQTVKSIYRAIRQTEAVICESFMQINPILPERVHFTHTQELERMYPYLSVKQREREICKNYGAVCIEGIGYPLTGGKPSDGRAPDYDDWSTLRPDGYRGLNGDILVWHPAIDDALELSSMGIRVDKDALEFQLQLHSMEHRKELWFHQKLISGTLPQSIGGGIGQSRLCMFLLRKAHIGEVQASVWPLDIVKDCQARNIPLL
ncbi:MAG: aspartate--ammonia ligase [Bacteroidales bacterium]